MPTSGPDFAHPSDPALYQGHLCNILAIPSTNSDVVDLTGYIECGTFIASGGCGQIFKGKWKDVGGAAPVLPSVVVKVVNVPPLRDEREKEKRLKRIKRELVLWNSLRHDNILPLIGIARMNNDANLPAFVSPWMQNGSVVDFLKENPTFPVATFLRGIIEGLYYLHTFDPEVIHGDIKAANVLVNHRKEAYLCDFGLSRFTVDNTLWRTTATHSNGTLRWMAPELLEGEACVPTKASDIYAYGLTCYEILAGKPPFDSVRNDVAIIRKVMNGERPDRIDSCHVDAWAIITQCWAQEAGDRPSTKDVLKSVRRFTLPIVQPPAVVRSTSNGGFWGSVGAIPAPRRVSPSSITFSAGPGPGRRLEPPRPPSGVRRRDVSVTVPNRALNLPVDFQPPQPDPSSYTWESNDIWSASGDPLLTNDDSDLRAIPPIELELPICPEYIGFHVTSGLGFGQEYAQLLEGQQIDHLDNLFLFKEMVAGYGF